MAKGMFGERLKRERELREVSLQEIAKGTRIAERFLEALENEQWNKLPGGVFGRGFVRSIARYLGLSEENLLSDYDLARGESVLQASGKPEERIPSPPKWIPAVAAIAVVLLLAVLLVFARYAWKAYQARRAQKKASATVGLPSAGGMRALPLPESPKETHALARPADKPTRVRTAYGNRAFRCAADCLKRPAIPGVPSIGVVVGDPQAVLLELNGQDVAPSGEAAFSGTIVLTERDLRQANLGDTQR
jgi:cytoskeletal protein RodZ